MTQSLLAKIAIELNTTKKQNQKKQTNKKFQLYTVKDSPGGWAPPVENHLYN